MVLMKSSRHLGHSPGPTRNRMLHKLTMGPFEHYSLKREEEGADNVFAQVPYCDFGRYQLSDEPLNVLRSALGEKGSNKSKAKTPSCNRLLPAITDR